jgi:hypothetical protein
MKHTAIKTQKNLETVAERPVDKDHKHVIILKKLYELSSALTELESISEKISDPLYDSYDIAEVEEKEIITSLESMLIVLPNRLSDLCNRMYELRDKLHNKLF